MTDINCLLAGLVRLLVPVLLLIFWRKRTGARIFPALAAFLVCLPVFTIAGLMRTGLAQNDLLSFCLKQGILYGIFEEGSKYLALRFLLSSYDDRRDAVSYGIGHGTFESFSGGIACINLIGTGRAAPYILPVNLFTAIEGVTFAIALTVLIFYGIQTGRTKIMLPVAIFLHFISNATTTLYSFSTPIVVIKSTVLTAGICYAAYHCFVKLRAEM
ncbi:MAG: YhfC family intramembrane metalloprotease [Ruminococcus sp.]|nr:YhfC family intramembrane metalloprotease [Ruminococcus sp.]